MTRLGGARSGRPTASGPSIADRSWVVGFFTAHPLAKLSSLGLAVLMVWMIDRELLEDIYDEEVTVVQSAPEGAKNTLEVKAPPGYVILLDPARPLTAHIVINAHKRDRDRIRQPFSARLPKGRVEAVVGTRGMANVPVEANDIRVDGLDVQLLGSLEVPVARRDTKRVPLSVEVPAEQSLTASAHPRHVRVTGPQPQVQRLTGLTLIVEGPMSDEDFRDLVVTELRSRDSHLDLAEDQPLRLEVTRGQPKTAEITFHRVPVRLV